MKRRDEMLTIAAIVASVLALIGIVLVDVLQANASVTTDAEKGRYYEAVPEVKQTIAETTETPETTEISTQAATESEAETEEETTEQIKETTVIETEPEIPIYSVNGTILDVDLQVYLFEALDSKGIGYWMAIAVAQAYQESGFDTEQITNGIDMGLYQYRCPYWDEWQERAGLESRRDILDPYAQIDVYAEMVSQWLEEGNTESVVISNHNTGGWGGSYAEQYVAEVSQWFPVTLRIN